MKSHTQETVSNTMEIRFTRKFRSELIKKYNKNNIFEFYRLIFRAVVLQG